MASRTVTPRRCSGRSRRHHAALVGRDRGDGAQRRRARHERRSNGPDRCAADPRDVRLSHEVDGARAVRHPQRRRDAVRRLARRLLRAPPPNDDGRTHLFWTKLDLDERSAGGRRQRADRDLRPPAWTTRPRRSARTRARCCSPRRAAPRRMTSTSGAPAATDSLALMIHRAVAPWLIALIAACGSAANTPIAAPPPSAPATPRERSGCSTLPQPYEPGRTSPACGFGENFYDCRGATDAATADCRRVTVEWAGPSAWCCPREGG